MAAATPHQSTSPTWDEDPRIGHAVVVGSIVGIVVAFLATTAGMLAGGVEGGAAIGFGLFVAFWGGLGFGSMMGGVAGAAQIARDEHAGDEPGATAAD